MLRINSIIVVIILFVQAVFAQSSPAPATSAAEIKVALKKMQVLGSVLYVAAHPDDENTRLLGYFAKERGMETAYLSLTRGDGGQNLIGKETRELLGIIRTQELLAARRTDGAQQFFSRANDFGFSKGPEETQQIWDRDKVFADMVWIIRKFQPDVIITRFPTNGDGGHGHHTTSAIMAQEAFTAAADPNKYPEQLKYVQVWQAKRILWNTWQPQRDPKFDASKFLKVDPGTYNPLLGKSYGEIAGESRSMHKSQGFGAARTKGSTPEYLDHWNGDRAQTDVFDGVNTTWTRVPGGEKVGKLLAKAYSKFDVEHPESSLPLLLDVHKALKALPPGHYVTAKTEELEQLILQCAGVWVEATSPAYSASPGDSVQVNASIVKRLLTTVKLEKVNFQYAENNAAIELPLNVVNTSKQGVKLPADLAYSQPYWLRERPQKGIFVVNDQEMIGLPENSPAVQVTFTVRFGETAIDIKTPVLYKWVDEVEGEKYRPLEITPPVTVNLPEKAYIFTDNQPKTVELTVKANTQSVNGDLSLSLPTGWRSEPASIPFNINGKYQEQNVEFRVFPSSEPMTGTLKAVAKVNRQELSHSLLRINYNHIPVQTLFPPAEAQLVRVNVQKRGTMIGYIMGAGDDIPAALQQIGYQVKILSSEEITLENLRKYDAVIAGVRAYNINDRLKYQQDVLLKYVEEGGTLIVQYNTANNISELVTSQIGPYPITLSRERVTVEEAPVTFLKPEHPLLNNPNKITEADFQNWVQERGLYFPNKWDDKYEAIISSNDPGETPKNGGILVAKYGKGNYIYTSYSWFRELPAGVPGAYRIFANMISIGK